jgi:hypothetical protein
LEAGVDAGQNVVFLHSLLLLRLEKVLRLRRYPELVNLRHRLSLPFGSLGEIARLQKVLEAPHRVPFSVDLVELHLFLLVPRISDAPARVLYASHLTILKQSLQIIKGFILNQA